MHVVTEVDPETGALLRPERLPAPTSPARVAFADVDRRPRTLTADRAEFLGRNGSLAAPAALAPGRALRPRRARRLDPCAAIQTTFELAPGEETEIVFLLGEAGDGRGRAPLDSALSRAGTAVARRSTRSRPSGTGVLDAVQVQTPDPALDLLLNRWLLYQVLSCRVWGRSAFYQSGGAYGFRDQLQDVMALVHAAPGGDARRRSCARRRGSSSRATCSTGGIRPSGRGRPDADLRRPPLAAVRRRPLRRRPPATRRSSTSRSRSSKAPVLEPDQEDDLRLRRGLAARPARSTSTASGPSSAACGSGAHGLPLMGTGDWNDGMNRVGARARARASGSPGS